MLSQDDALDPEWTIREAVLGDLPEHVWAGDPRIRDVLTGLLGGIGAENVGGLDSRVGPKSGGERRRLALARCSSPTPTCCSSTSRPTTSTSRRRLAGRPPGDEAPAPRQRDRRDHPRPLVPRRRLRPDVGGRRAAGQRVTRAATRRTSSPRPSATGMAAVVADRRANLMRKELAWLRRGAAGAHDQAEVPHRRRQRPHRRRAGPPRPRRARRVRDAAPRQGRARPRGRRPSRWASRPTSDACSTT